MFFTIKSAHKRPGKPSICFESTVGTFSHRLEELVMESTKGYVSGLSCAGQVHEKCITDITEYLGPGTLADVCNPSGMGG